MTTHKMNLICNIQAMQEAIGLDKDRIENIKTYSVEFLEKKRNNLIKDYNNLIVMYSLYIYSLDGNYETPAQYTYKQANELWRFLDSINVDATIITRNQ